MPINREREFARCELLRFKHEVLMEEFDIESNLLNEQLEEIKKITENNPGFNYRLVGGEDGLQLEVFRYETDNEMNSRVEEMRRPILESIAREDDYIRRMQEES